MDMKNKQRNLSKSDCEYFVTILYGQRMDAEQWRRTVVQWTDIRTGANCGQMVGVRESRPSPPPQKEKKRRKKKKVKKKKVILAVAGPMEIGTSVTQGPENQDKCDQFSLHFGKSKVYLCLAESD